MTKIKRSSPHHHLAEPLDHLAQILQIMLDDAKTNSDGKFSKEKMQRFERLWLIFQKFFEKITQQNIPLEYEFLESVALLVDQIVFVRDEDVFVKKAQASDIALMKKLADMIASIYELIYSQRLVQKVLGKVAHVATRFPEITDKVAAQKLIDELWEKVRKAELASNEADKKLSAVVKTLQEFHDKEATKIPKDLSEEFLKFSMEAYLLGAASTLALEELSQAKAHLAKLIAAGK